MFTRPLLYCGLLGPTTLIVGFLVEGATRPGYSPWRHAVSQLSLGPGGPVNVALILLGAAGLLALAVALPTNGSPRWTTRTVATAGAALAVLAIFPIDASLGYPPDQPAVHHWQGLVHAIAGTVLFAALAATPLTMARHVRGRAGWVPWRRYSILTGLVVAVSYVVTATLTSLDQAGMWTNAPAGLTQRIALIAGLGWCALFAGRLLESTGRVLASAGRDVAQSPKRSSA